MSVSTLSYLITGLRSTKGRSKHNEGWLLDFGDASFAIGDRAEYITRLDDGRKIVLTEGENIELEGVAANPVLENTSVLSKLYLMALAVHTPELPKAILLDSSTAPHAVYKNLELSTTSISNTGLNHIVWIYPEGGITTPSGGEWRYIPNFTSYEINYAGEVRLIADGSVISSVPGFASQVNIVSDSGTYHKVERAVLQILAHGLYDINSERYFFIDTDETNLDPTNLTTNPVEYTNYGATLDLDIDEDNIVNVG